MKSGDKVTGVPLGELQETHSTVTGRYEEVDSTLGDSSEKIGFVVVGQDYIDCTDIRPAGRREKETVLS